MIVSAGFSTELMLQWCHACTCSVMIRTNLALVGAYLTSSIIMYIYQILFIPGMG